MVDGTEMVTAELYIHVEDGDGETVWWAESPQMPGFTAAASSFAEVKRLSFVALEAVLGGPVLISIRVAADHCVTFSKADAEG